MRRLLMPAVLLVATALAGGGYLLFRGGHRARRVSPAVESFRASGSKGVVQADFDGFFSSPWAKASLEEILRRRYLVDSASDWLKSFVTQHGQLVFAELTGSDNGGVLVVETKVPADVEFWKNFLGSYAPRTIEVVETHAGVDIYSLDAKTMMAFPAEKLTVFGTLAGVRTGLDNFRAGRPGRLDPAAERLLASVPSEACLVAAGISGREPAAWARIVTKNLVDASGLETSLTFLSVSGDAVLVSRTRARDARQAEELRKELREKLARTPNGNPPREESRVPLSMREALDSVEISGSGRECELRMELPVGMVADLIGEFRKALAPPKNTVQAPPGAVAPAGDPDTAERPAQ